MIRLAKKVDLISIMNIIEATRPLLIKQGSKQWNTSDKYPSLETFEKDINNNILYVMEIKNKIVAVVAISDEIDNNYNNIKNGKWLTTSNKYISIHRLAVLPSLYSKGYGLELIKFAYDLARKKHFSSLRVDTHSVNIPMKNLLLKAGFKECGIIILKRTKEDNIRVAYELII